MKLFSKLLLIIAVLFAAEATQLHALRGGWGRGGYSRGYGRGGYGRGGWGRGSGIGFGLGFGLGNRYGYDGDFVDSYNYDDYVW